MKLLGFKITIKINLKITNFLDVTLNLDKGNFKLFKKESNTPIYIYISSNYPPSIIKQIPIYISHRLSDNSSNIDIFNSKKNIYNNAVKKSGYTQQLEYTPPKTKPNNRKRNIIWFNPPYSKNVKTNISKDFIKLIEKHFPKHSSLAIIFNKNNLKISYSCMKNMTQIIKKNNNKKIENNYSTTECNNQCNCRDKSTCPLQGNCLKKRGIQGHSKDKQLNKILHSNN